VTKLRNHQSMHLSKAILGAALLLLASGCGGGTDAPDQAAEDTTSESATDDSTDQAQTTEDDGAETAVTDQADDGGDLIEEARAAIEQHSAPLEFEAPGPQIDASEADGGHLHVVVVDLAVPALNEVSENITAVGGEAGLGVTVSNAEGQVPNMQQGFQRGLDEGADAIVMLGIPAVLVESQLVSASEAGVPVINVLNNQPDADAPGQGAGEGFFATVAPDFRLGGQLAAYRAVLDTDGEVNALLLSTDDMQPSPAVMSGFNDVLDRCDSCTTRTEDVPLDQWGTGTAPLVVSAIGGDPELNYILPIFDGMGLFAASGVQQAGAEGRVHVASFNASSAALAMIRDGDVFAADPGQSNRWAAWATVDQALRGMLDEEPADPALPVRYFDDEVLADTDIADDVALFGDDYQDGYRELWGLE
jgi:ribose transport system substrate-binding protein